MQPPPKIQSFNNNPQFGSAPPSIPASRPPVIGNPPPVTSGGPTPPLQPKPAGKPWPIGRIFAALLACVIVGLVLTVGLFLWNQLTRQDTKEDYVFLCSRLFETIPAAGDTTINLSPAEIEVRVQNHKEEARQLSQRGKKLAPIAQQYCSLVDRFEALHRTAPDGSKIVLGLAEAALGAYTGQREHIGAGSQKALAETEKGLDALQELEACINQKHLLAVELAQLVPQFSGAVTNKPLVACSFAEHKPWLLEPSVTTKEAITLVNSSDRDLHNCVIAVRLSNETGESYINYYFIPDWQKNQKRVAQYSDTAFPRLTVDDITRVDVSLWTSELSLEPMVLKRPSNSWPDLE